jgi:hypothetical protein
LDVLIVILVLLALAGAVAVAWKCWQGTSGFRALNSQPGEPMLRNPEEEPPTEPAFIIQSPPSPGFTVVSVTGGHDIPSPRNAGAKMSTAAANGFEFVGVTQNLTAICKLTGRQAANCSCDRHRGKKIDV